MARRRRFDVRPLLKEKMRFDVPEASAIRRYLHGDVSSREMEAPVYWEYCRLNAEMIRIASLCRQVVNRGSYDATTETMIEANSDEFMSDLWAAIWSSVSFPVASWFDLDAATTAALTIPIHPHDATIFQQLSFPTRMPSAVRCRTTM